MDSRKFKKVNKQSQYHKNRRRKKRTYNKKYILYFIMIIIVSGVIIGVLGGNNSIPEDTKLIKPVIFDFTPYGYDWNKELYGYCNATDENGNMHTYYFNLDQMAALYKSSGGTFNFSDGMYVTVNNTTGNKNIVTDIYKKNRAEIIKPYDYNEYEFAKNARFIGMNQTYCARGFGFTTEEYNDSSF